MNATAPRFAIERPVIKAALARRLGWLRGWRRSVLALGGVGFLAVVIVWALSGNGQNRAAAPSAPRNTEVAANGVVEGAGRELPLAPEAAGTLKAVFVQLHQDVPAGALLFELANDSQRAQVVLAEAELAAAQAQLTLAEADLARSQQMTRGSAVSKQEHDQVFYRVKTASAKKQEAEARLQLARAELAKTRVVAPVAGRILQIHKEAGVQIAPGGRGGEVDPVLHMANVSRRRARAFVEELDAGRIQVGQAATVTADGFPGREYSGRVVEVSGRMGGKNVPRSDGPGEYKDMYYREVVIELEGAEELTLGLRIQARIAGHSPR